MPNAAGDPGKPPLAGPGRAGSRDVAARVPRVGVLALQGDYARHIASLEMLGVSAPRVVRAGDLEGLDAIVLPGGESTTMLRVMAANGLREPLAGFVRTHPSLGTCAGVILLGTDASALPAPPLGVLDVTVERNAYGRQIDSFAETVEAPVVGGGFHAVFIRAPRLRRIGAGVEVIARRPARAGEAGEPVGVRSGRTVGLCFHPELTSDLRFHRWFLTAVAGLALPAAADDAATAGAPGAGSGL